MLAYMVTEDGLLTINLSTKNSVYCQQIFFLLSLFVIRQHYSPRNYTYTSYTVHI